MVSHYVSKNYTLNSYASLCFPTEQWLKLNENIQHVSITVPDIVVYQKCLFLQSAYISKCHRYHEDGRRPCAWEV